ncbi:MAG: hypothetical protein FWE82_08880, partial [Defluviitaleaceae bacterium]|nr:hypothetical protein [Defluviitaleaceae bacterium]
LCDKLAEIKKACQIYDERTADKAVSDLRKHTWSYPVKKMISSISEYLLHSEFDEAAEVAEKYHSPNEITASNNHSADMNLLLDTKKGIERYNNDEDIYKKILSSFLTNIGPMIVLFENVTPEKMNEYKIKVHAVKSICFDIFAEKIAGMASDLEKAAAIENFKFIAENNPIFVESVKKLEAEIKSFI